MGNWGWGLAVGFGVLEYFDNLGVLKGIVGKQVKKGFLGLGYVEH